MMNEAGGQVETSRSTKIVPKSKVTDWAGLDRIAAVVHGMACIWREQEKEDIGNDGEIELCSPRHDGDGMIRIERIVKVQSKAGSKYVIRDRDDSFASPVTDKDLNYWNGMNLPVVYIVFHPDDGRSVSARRDSWKTSPRPARPSSRREKFSLSLGRRPDARRVDARLRAGGRHQPDRLRPRRESATLRPLIPSLARRAMVRDMTGEI
jgi:hypothetical protein